MMPKHPGKRFRLHSQIVLAITLLKVVVMFVGVIVGERLISVGEACDQVRRAPISGWVSMTPAGPSLAAKIDQLDVEHHWLRSDARIAWRSGDPIAGRPEKGLPPLARTETHCSAFAASVADHRRLLSPFRAILWGTDARPNLRRRQLPVLPGGSSLVAKADVRQALASW